MQEDRPLDPPTVLTRSMIYKLTALLTLLSVLSAADLGFRGLRRYPLPSQTPVWTIPGGVVEHGEGLTRKYGCAACHTLRGVRSAQGMVGPGLEDFGSRVFIAGRLPNTPDALIRWIQDPQKIDAETAMPDLGVSAEEARHMAAYLYSED